MIVGVLVFEVSNDEPKANDDHHEFDNVNEDWARFHLLFKIVADVVTAEGWKGAGNSINI